MSWESVKKVIIILATMWLFLFGFVFYFSWGRSCGLKGCVCFWSPLDDFRRTPSKTRVDISWEFAIVWSRFESRLIDWFDANNKFKFSSCVDVSENHLVQATKQGTTIWRKNCVDFHVMTLRVDCQSLHKSDCTENLWSPLFKMDQHQTTVNDDIGSPSSHTEVRMN